MTEQPYAGLLERLQGLSVDGSSGYGMPIAAEAAEAISSLLKALHDIETSARGSGPLARDRDADTLAAIERFAAFHGGTNG